MIVDRAIYVGGERTVAPDDIGEVREAARERGGMAWFALHEPPEEELDGIAREFEFHPLAVEDAVKAHQRPKLERYGETLFVVLKTTRYDEESEEVEFGEIHIFTGRDFVVTVRHGSAQPLKEVRRRLEGDSALLALGPVAVLYAIMDYVVDGYAPVLDGIESDVDEAEADVFGGNSNSRVSRRVYRLSRQIILFHRATKPLAEVLDRFTEERRYERRKPHDDSGETKPRAKHDAKRDTKRDVKRDAEVEISRYLRDVHDHALRVNDRVESMREVVSNILNVNLAIIGMTQTDQTKRISAWAAILIIPTIITGVYGMNFTYMPELDLPFGYPAAVILMLVLCVILYFAFKRRGWL